MCSPNSTPPAAQALAAAAASAEQVLVTAAVVDDIPREWLADRIDITLNEDETGPVSAVLAAEQE